MNQVTGDLILKDPKVDQGVFNGQLPQLFVGRVRLPWNRQVGVANSKHQYLIQGLDSNGVTCYVCACGEGFLGACLAYDHLTEVSSATEGNGNDDVTQISVEWKQLPKSNSDEPLLDDVDMNEMESDLQLQEEATGFQLVENMESETVKKSNRTPILSKLLAETIFAKHGCDMELRYKHYCASELKINFQTLQSYIKQFKKRNEEGEENSYAHLLSSSIRKEAEDIHLKVQAYIKNGTNPCEHLDNTRPGIIVRYLCGRHRTLTFKYRKILADMLGIDAQRMIELYTSAIAVKNLRCYVHMLPRDLIKEARRFNEEILYKLREEDPNAKPNSKLQIPGPHMIKERLIMEAIWKKYGLKLDANYRKQCADIMKIKNKVVYTWWTNFKLFAVTLKDHSCYNNAISKEIEVEAEKLHKAVLQLLDGVVGTYQNHGLPLIPVRTRLLFEAVLESHAEHVNRRYKELWSAKFGISRKAVDHYDRQAQVRDQFGLENPLAHLLTSNIRKESMEVHAEVMTQLKS